MNIVIIQRSKKPSKKFDATINGVKTVSFGQHGASDYTIHKDKERRDRYILRHRKNEDWSNPLTAGFYSRWLLWNLPSLKASLDDMNNKFKHLNIQFILR